MITFKEKIKNIIDNQHSVSLRFLNLEEQSYLTKKKDVILYGGYNDAERKRAYFFDNQEDNIIPIKIDTHSKHLQLSHQNILGTLLSLGITHDSIGDILPKQGIVFITKEISKEIFLSFQKINNVDITISIYNGAIHSENDYEEFKTTVDSLRLDLVVSKIAKISRNEATEMIQKELIKLNHQIHQKPTTTVKETDVISIRKCGRFRILDTSKTSRKGKIILIYLKYI